MRGAAAQNLAAVTLGDLAGSYYQGDSLGLNLTLSLNPDGTFELAWNGCLGRYATARGQVSIDGEELVLETSMKEGDLRVPARLRVVSWGDRTYLMPPEELAKLANAMNHGDEPRSSAMGFFLLRDGDWERPASGLPDLPASSLDLLLPHPVAGTVLRKLEGASVEIDVGARDGLKPGMDLYAIGKALRQGLCQLTVVSVSEDSAIAQGNEDCKRLRAEMRVCSRLEEC